ncbi:hypothetical protein F4780DRAFT_608049 [Xylariomycetidae sp. FL0641]|nr:hypothetical protein F4780DRAFT_608049 [Xylariomycetidae sp. FL0641]
MAQSSTTATASTHHTIVALETFFCPLPDLKLPPPHTCEVRAYARTRPEQVAERIRDADIVVLTTIPLSADALSAKASPRLKLVAVVASGTDSVDLAACRARGIAVANTPHCNATAVAEHALALYLAARRSVVLSHALARAGAWPARGTLLRTLDGPDGRPPRTARDETVGIVGYGAVGRKFEGLARALGMRTLVAGRKGAAADDDAPDGRTPFAALLREASVLLLCLPRAPETLGLVARAELDAMRGCAVLVNVSRGGIVDEAAVVAALKARTIAGYATDVYAAEPAGPENSPLMAPDTAELNIVTTPHVAWCAEDTNENYNRALMDNITGFLTTGQTKYPVV